MFAFTKLLLRRISACVCIFCVLLICIFMVWWPFPVDVTKFESANAQLFTLSNLVMICIGSLIVLGASQPGKQDKESIENYVSSQLESNSVNSLVKSVIRMAAISRKSD